jgi:hypothetical protein
MSDLYAEFEADKAAVADAGFCSLWPTAVPILTTLAGLIRNPIAKIAIRTVIAAGNAYCGLSVSLTSQATERLSLAGLKGLDNLSPAQLDALEGMSDSELHTLAKYQKAVNGATPQDFGHNFF